MKQRSEKFLYLGKRISWEMYIDKIAVWYPLALYKNNWFISVYPDSPKSGLLVDIKVFEQIRDNLPSLDYIPNISFFKQFNDLFLKTPKPHLHHFSGCENASYTNYTSNTKNAYLSFNTTGDCEHVFYSLSTKIHSKNIFYSVMCWLYCENIYQSFCITKSSQIFYSSNIHDSFDLWFCENMTWCQNCIDCNNLDHKQYYIHNEFVGKEEFEKQYDNLITKLQHQKDMKYQKNDFTLLSSDYSSSFCSYNIHHCHNMLFCGHEDGLMGSANVVFWSWGKECYLSCAINGDSERIYGSVGLRKCFDVWYSYYCEHCSFCLWCVWLKNKSYCILNKQYTKEERELMVEIIFTTMENDWEFGQFFPSETCPFDKEETLAGLFFHNTNYKNNQNAVLQPWELSSDDLIWFDFGDYLMLMDTIIVDKYGKKYKLLKEELLFMQKYKLRLPTSHWLHLIKEKILHYL